MVPRSAIVLLVFLVFVGACASEQIAQEGTEEQRRSGEVEPERPTAGPALTATVEPTPTRTPTAVALPDAIKTPVPPCVGNGESDKLCEARDVSGFGLFSDSLGHPSVTPSVEEVLEEGLELSGASPVHLAFRGTAQSDKIRCEWRGVARTIQQREKSIRYWLGMDEDEALPSPAEVERRFIDYVNRMDPRAQAVMEANLEGLAWGGLTPKTMFLTCFVDYTVSEYPLGPTEVTPATLTVAYDKLAEVASYDLYKRSHEGGRYDNEPLTPPGQFEANMAQVLVALESVLIHIVGGRESVVFLAPMGAYHAIAFEAWQVLEQWDLQTDENDVVHAVRYGVPEGDPEQTQTLASLKSRITTAAASDDHADDRIENASGLTQYYRDIGAYGDITPGGGSTATFTPAQPPAVLNCANGTAVTDASTNRGLVHDCEALLEGKDALRGTATLDWVATSAVMGWEGITTGGTPSRVTKVLLAGESLSGSIPSSLGRLFELTHLNLSSNSLTGEIPLQLGRLENLEELRLSGNSLTGCIPLPLKDVATNDLSSLNLPYCQPPAPGNLTAGTALETSIPLSWDAVTNASKYRVEYRNPEGTGWFVLSDTLSAPTYTMSNLDCGTEHRFRVSAHVRGTNYATGWSDTSTALGASTVLCPPPVFQAKSYAFDVKEGAPRGHVVGSVMAKDDRGISVTYDIIGNDVYGKFAIGRESGEIIVAGSLKLDAGTTVVFTVEAEARDERGFRSTVTVEVRVLADGS